MRPKELVLRCFVQKESDGTWFAMCLDLNLYARGASLQEARDKLRGFVRHYVAAALGKDREYVGDLIPRRAPFGFWVKYYGMRTLLWCGAHIARVLYKESLPLKLA